MALNANPTNLAAKALALLALVERPFENSVLVNLLRVLGLNRESMETPLNIPLVMGPGTKSLSFVIPREPTVSDATDNLGGKQGTQDGSDTVTVSGTQQRETTGIPVSTLDNYTNGGAAMANLVQTHIGVLARDLESFCVQQCMDFNNVVGTSAGRPFASNADLVYSADNEIFTKGKRDGMAKFLLLAPTDATDLMKTSEFSEYRIMGQLPVTDVAQISTREIHGKVPFRSLQVFNHTAGSNAGTGAVAVQAEIGDTSISLDDFTVSQTDVIKKGDIFYFSGDTSDRYVAAADVDSSGAGAGTVTTRSAVTRTIAAAEALTVVESGNSYSCSFLVDPAAMFFHMLARNPMQANHFGFPVGSLGGLELTMIQDGHHLSTSIFPFYAAYCKVIRPQWGCRIIGPTLSNLSTVEPTFG